MSHVNIICDKNSQLHGLIMLLAMQSLLKHTHFTSSIEIRPTALEADCLPKYLTISPEEWSWLLSLGLDETQVLAKSDGAFCLGWSFKNWLGIKQETFCGFAPLLAPVEGARGANLAARFMRENQHQSNFQQHSTALYSLNGQCWKTNHFSHPVNSPTNILSTLEYGVQLNVEGLCEVIQSKCSNPREFTGNLEGTSDTSTSSVLSISLLGNNFTDAMASANIKTSNNTSGSLACELSVSEQGFGITHFGRTTASSWRLNTSTIAKIVKVQVDVQTSSQSLSMHLPASMMLCADMGITTIRQYISRLSQMLPTNQGWLSNTQNVIKNNLQEINATCRLRALLPLYLSGKNASNSAQCDALINNFVHCGMIEEAETPLFDQAIMENLLLAFNYLPQSESGNAHLLNEEALSSLVNRVQSQFKQSAMALPNHKEYLERYLSRYL